MELLRIDLTMGIAHPHRRWLDIFALPTFSNCGHWLRIGLDMGTRGATRPSPI